MKNNTRRFFVIFTFGLLFVFALSSSKTYAGNLYYQDFSSYTAGSRLTSAQTGGSAYYTSGSATAGGDNARISGAWEATNLPSLNTTGNYLMMWTDVNGPSIPTTDAGRTFFSQTGTVTPNTNYKISYKIAGLSSSSLASVKMLINGTQVIATSAVTYNSWTTKSYTWNSSTNTSLTFSLINTNGSTVNGNDFGLDDVLIEGTDLEITKSHTGNFTVGSTGTYSLAVKNTGGVASSGTITVSDTLPAGLTIPDGAITEGGTNAANWTCTAASNVITCTSSTAIAAGGTSTFSYSVNVGLGTAVGTNSITNTANVSGGGEIITTNNSASDPTTILSPNLTISKSHTPTTFVRGSTGTYILTVSNTGTAASSGTITVTDTLPTGLTVTDGAITEGGTNAANWTCTAASNIITCTSTTAIATSGSSVFSFGVNVSASVANSVTNTATVSGGNEATANNTNNSANDVTNVQPNPPNIELLKSCPTPANCTTSAQLPGTDVTYKIQFTNTGGSSAQSVKFVDNIPANTDYKIGSATNDVGTTGLTISIEYSNDYDPLNPTLATWTYTPVSGGGGASAGYDRLVKAIRWRVTAGSLSNVSPNNVGSVSFITKIR